MYDSVDLTQLQQQLLTQALAYATAGFRVFPCHSFFDGLCTCEDPNCHSPGKHPLTEHGHLDATTDPEQICKWWAEAPVANIGVNPGENQVVLDVDVGGEATLAQHDPLPATLTVKTGSGGRHYWFSLPPGVKLKNKARFAPGLDTRTCDGYVLAPSSRHASGGNYDWLTPLDTPLAPCPDWIVALARVEGNSPHPQAGAEANAGGNSPHPQANTRSGGVSVLAINASDDLVSHPGAVHGEANDAFCRLAGIHIDRGDSDRTIEALATAWGARCTPTVQWAGDLHKKFQSLIKTHNKKQGNADDGDDSPLPPPRLLPTLPAAAYYGLAGDVVQTILPHTEADPAGLLLTFLVCVGNLFGRRAYYPAGGSRHYANLFLATVGKSSKGRKGVALATIMNMFDGYPDWKKDCHASGLSSGEGLVYAVRDPIFTIDNEGKPKVKDAGVTDKRLQVKETEFGGTLAVLRREGNTLSALIRMAWDDGNLEVKSKNSPHRATDAHVSIIAHITEPELKSLLGTTHLWNGFANRFLWALVQRSKLLAEDTELLNLLMPLRTRLSEVNQAVAEITSMSRSPSAAKLWREQIYPLLTADRPGLAGAVTSRAEAQTLRLSMLYALLDSTNVIDEAHLRAAYALWCYCQTSAEAIFGCEPTDALEAKLLGIIRAYPGLHRKGIGEVTGKHLKSIDIGKALAGLIEQRLIRVEADAHEGGRGRPCERFYPVAPPTLTPLPPLADADKMPAPTPAVTPSADADKFMPTTVTADADKMPPRPSLADADKIPAPPSPADADKIRTASGNSPQPDASGSVSITTPADEGIGPHPQAEAEAPHGQGICPHPQAGAKVDVPADEISPQNGGSAHVSTTNPTANAKGISPHPQAAAGKAIQAPATMGLAELIWYANEHGYRFLRGPEGVMLSTQEQLPQAVADALRRHVDALLPFVSPEQGKLVVAVAYPDAEAVLEAIRISHHARVVKDDTGHCRLELRKPDSDLEAAFARYYDAVCGQYLTESQFVAELQRLADH